MTHEERKNRLTPREKLFVKEYSIDFKGAEAFMRATGNTNKKSAAVQASKLLATPRVKEALELFIKETLGPHEKHIMENVEFWIKIRDDEEVRPADRLKASENLAKYQQMFIEKKDVTVSGQVQIVEDIPKK